MEKLDAHPISVVILEKTLKVLFGGYQFVATTFLKTLKTDKPTKIPPITNSIVLQSATDIARKIRNKELTSSQVVTAFIQRMEEINSILNFIVEERFKEALDEANKVDEYLGATTDTVEEIEKNTPFLGVPCTVKESLAVRGMCHTVGLHSRKHIIATEDADVVKNLRDAGAIPLCVTNTPEVCCWWETYNPLHGRTNNPYNTSHTSGGSSGGEGAVIAAGGSVIGLGSDFGGSIRIPAAFNGIFGHRPTSEITSIKGHHPIPRNDELKTLLVMGPLTRYAKDLKPILKIITKTTVTDLNLDDPVDLKKVKFYYLKEGSESYLATPVQPSIQFAIRKVAAHFRSMGAHVEEVTLPRMKYAMLYWYARIKTDDGPQLGKELANHEGNVSIVSELCKSLVGTSKHTLPVLLFGILEAANGIPYKGSLHSAVLNEYEALLQQFKSLLGDSAIFIHPTHPTTAIKHGDGVTKAFDIGYTAVFNALGFPATQCPVGLDEKGLPIGVQVVANLRQDRLTLAAAEEIERVFGGWLPPCDTV